MVRKLIEWAVHNPLLVILFTVALAIGGSYCFLNVNVEAYPDPAPAIIEVVAQYPGASAEEVERQVTIPLEVTLAGMPGLKYTRSKSLYGLSHLRNQFDYGIDFYAARQEVINRLQFTQALPSGVSPQISPTTPTGELMRYTLTNPRDERGRPVYSLSDLKALEDWTLERAFKRVPRVIDVSGFGGTVKRYEIHPDPDRLKMYGVTLQQLQNAIANSNANVGADILRQGSTVMNVRGIGLIGGGLDPMQATEVLGLETQELNGWLQAAGIMTDAEMDRLDEETQKHVTAAFKGQSTPPLRPEERPFLRQLRLSAALKGQKLQPPLDAGEENDLRKLRLATGFKGEAVSPPLSAEENLQVRELRHTLGALGAEKAAVFLRSEEERRIREIREIVIASVNNVPVRVEQVVEGGPIRSPGEELGKRGVVVGYQTRLGKVSLTHPQTNARGEVVHGKDGNVVWQDDQDVVMGIVLMRKGEETLPALEGVKGRLQQLNDQPGRLLPGVQIIPHFDLTGLIHVTTDTVRENLGMGMALVTVILLMFLSNIRSALIVAINIPLALLFAFAVLFLRGKSANLLSIGAVDFGIIVDSSVIMVENIYRHISSGEYAELPLRERIIRACHEVEKGLFFSTAIMVCAFIPLFTMQGPEGQIFGPMANTYAFALGGALLLALMLSPVLCLLLFKHLKPSRDNFLVRYLRASYLRQLERCLNHRWLTLGLFAVMLAITVVFAVDLGREFMPELEEGNLYIRGTFPVNISLEDAAAKADLSRAIMRTYPEVELIQSQVGRPDDGTDPTGFYNVEFTVPLKPENEWPVPRTPIPPGEGVRGKIVKLDPDHNHLTIAADGAKEQEFHITDDTRIATRGGKDAPDRLKDKQFQKGTEVAVLFGPDGKTVREVRREYTRPRSKPELIEDMKGELDRRIVGVDWNFSQYIRDNVMEALSGVKGDNSVKIIGPDLEELEKIAQKVKAMLNNIAGIEDADVFRIKGQPNLEFPPDPKKGKDWGVSKMDVLNALQTAVGGRAVTQMTEGEKLFDITVRYPAPLRNAEHTILGIPVDVSNNMVTASSTLNVPQTSMTGGASGLSSLGTQVTLPSVGGSVYNAYVSSLSSAPRRRLEDLLTPLNANGAFDPNGRFVRPGASTIYREQGNRLIAVKFSVRGRDLAGAVAEAQEKTKGLLVSPYRAEWSGEFQEMEEAEHRLMYVIPLSLVLIFILLYLAFRSFLDTFAILSNVLALSMGGVWALLITKTNFSISAAVGFISIFGVAIMDGLLSLSYFNALRFQGLPLREAILEGAGRRVRPMMMTALTAIFGLLPAALSTRIGAQTQRPLAIVVVGGMIMTLLLNRYLMPVLYSFYGHREPLAEASRLAH